MHFHTSRYPICKIIKKISWTSKMRHWMLLVYLFLCLLQAFSISTENTSPSSKTWRVKIFTFFVNKLINYIRRAPKILETKHLLKVLMFLLGKKKKKLKNPTHFKSYYYFTYVEVYYRWQTQLVLRLIRSIPHHLLILLGFILVFRSAVFTKDIKTPSALFLSFPLKT